MRQLITFFRDHGPYAAGDRAKRVMAGVRPL